ncbi:malic enzyme-like NAD(P)-binding protein [Streptomyces sp. CA-249302]|uniref:malic enzyme-like NAD(P)-binding protein n=1 Tax=Streptomyces sp. CA-249302 TaxID=3240058 RepID=UPI003D923A0B
MRLPHRVPRHRGHRLPRPAGHRGTARRRGPPCRVHAGLTDSAIVGPRKSAGWQRDDKAGGTSPAEVVRRVRPTVLVGTSGQGGASTETVVREMAAHTERPIILPMSDPTRLAEAVPSELLDWTEGRALVATGSPFEAVAGGGITYEIGRANNALVFPGLGLGAVVARATRVTDAMLSAAAHAVAAQVAPTAPGAPLLPLTTELRRTSIAVAVAVARAEDGVARETVGDDIEKRVRRAMWKPAYRPVAGLVAGRAAVVVRPAGPRWALTAVAAPAVVAGGGLRGRTREGRN